MGLPDLGSEFRGEGGRLLLRNADRPQPGFVAVLAELGTSQLRRPRTGGSRFEDLSSNVWNILQVLDGAGHRLRDAVELDIGGLLPVLDVVGGDRDL